MNEPDLPVPTAWLRMKRVFQRDLPELHALLRPGATAAALDARKRAIRHPLPAAFRAAYSRHDGQALHAGLGVVFGRPLLPLSEIVRFWRYEMGQLAETPPDGNVNTLESDPTRRTRDVLRSAGWVPFCDSGNWTYLALDLDPGPAGTPGQVITCGDHEFRKRVLAPGFGAFLDRIAGHYGAGNWEMVELEDGVISNLPREPQVDHVFDALPILFPDPPGR